MDQSKLIDQVVKEVMRRLSLEERAVSREVPKVLVLGEPGCLPSPWEGVFKDSFLDGRERDVRDLEVLVVPRLDKCQLVASSLGMWCDPVSRWLVEGLSMGLRVYVLKEGLSWMDLIRRGSPLANHSKDIRRLSSQTTRSARTSRSSPVDGRVPPSQGFPMAYTPWVLDWSRLGRMNSTSGWGRGIT